MRACRRRAAGGVALVAFALALVVVLSAELMVANPVVVDETYHNEFYDLRDYVAGVVAEAQALPPDQRADFVREKLNAYSQEAEERGVTILFSVDDSTGEITYFMVHGNNTALGKVPYVIEVNVTSGEGAGAGGGETPPGNESGGGGGGEENDTNPPPQVNYYDFLVAGAGRSQFELSGTISFVAADFAWIFSDAGTPIYQIPAGASVDVTFGQNVGASVVEVRDGFVLVGQAGKPVEVTSVRVNGEEVISGPRLILLVAQAVDGTVNAHLNLYYYIESGSLYVEVEDWRYFDCGWGMNTEIEISGMDRGFIAMAGHPAHGGALLAQGKATHVRIGEREWS